MQRGAGWGAASSGARGSGDGAGAGGGGRGGLRCPPGALSQLSGKTFPGRLESLRLLTTEMGPLKSLPNSHF